MGELGTQLQHLQHKQKQVLAYYIWLDLLDWRQGANYPDNVF